MKTITIHPPQLVHEKYIDYPMFSMLPCWNISAFLKNKGYENHLLDAFSMAGASRSNHEPYFYLGANKEAFVSELQKHDFDIAIIHHSTFSVQEPTNDILQTTINEIRKTKKEAIIILADMHIGGMNYIDYDTNKYLQSEYAPDFIIKGEAETALLELLTKIEKGEDIPEKVIDGSPFPTLSTYNGDTYKIPNLDNYMSFLADYLRKDQRPNSFGFTAGSIPIKTSRGCKYSCAFCTGNPGRSAGHKPSWRKFDTDEILELIEKLATNKSIDKLIVLDEAANLNDEHFTRILQTAKKSGLKLEFPNGLRADALTNEHIDLLSDLISILSLSPESGSQNVVSTLIKKGQHLDIVEEKVKYASSKNIKVALHFMIGFPGETRKETGLTFAYAKKMYEKYGAMPWIQFVVPLPGTKLFDIAKERQLLPKLPTDFGPAFQGGPILKDGACELSNSELVRLKRAFMKSIEISKQYIS